MVSRICSLLPLLLMCLSQSVAAQTPGAQIPGGAAPAAQQASPTPAPLFCTLTAAHACTGATCTKSDSFGELKLPAKLLVHFENQVIASTSNDGFPHISHIASFAKTGNDYVLQGVDHASGWMIHLDEGGTKMSFVLTTNAIALIGTGGCKKAG